MTGEVVLLRDRAGLSSRLQRMVSIFEEIDTRELLAALPDCPVAQGSHLAALNLLAMVECELVALCNMIGAEFPFQTLDAAVSP